MNLSGNVVLVTGGATGIGRQLVKLFADAGSTVIAVGRRADKLAALVGEFPGVQTFAADLTLEAERLRLASWAAETHPTLNVLVNNAGVQERVRPTEPDFWPRVAAEIELNLKAPVHLCDLLVPQLVKNPRPAVINVTSGLAFVPMGMAPVYCATKAALRSFTQTLRVQLAGRAEVIEVIPPAVNTDLAGAGLHTMGVPVDDFGKSVGEQLAAGAVEVTYGTSAALLNAGPDERRAAFERMNSPRRP